MRVAVLVDARGLADGGSTVKAVDAALASLSLSGQAPAVWCCKVFHSEARTLASLSAGGLLADM